MPLESLGGIPIHYVRSGRGPLVVLVHGSWVDHRSWDSVADPLARSFEVLRYDRRGHGRSSSPPLEGTVHDDVADLAALIERFADGPAHVVGNSFGGSIALRLAAARPERVARVSVHEPPLIALLGGDAELGGLPDSVRRAYEKVVGLLEAGNFAEGAERFVEEVALGPGAWAELPTDIQEAFVQNALTFLGEARDPDAPTIDLDALARFEGPVQISEGEASPRMYRAIDDALCARLGRARRHTYAGAHHVPHLTHPERWVEALRDFLTDS